MAAKCLLFAKFLIVPRTRTHSFSLHRRAISSASFRANRREPLYIVPCRCINSSVSPFPASIHCRASTWPVPSSRVRTRLVDWTFVETTCATRLNCDEEDEVRAQVSIFGRVIDNENDYLMSLCAVDKDFSISARAGRVQNLTANHRA